MSNKFFSDSKKLKKSKLLKTRDNLHEVTEILNSQTSSSLNSSSYLQESIDVLDTCVNENDYEKTKVKFNKYKNEKIKKNTRNLVYMMDHNSLSEYSEIDHNDEIAPLRPVVRKNLDRVIRVHKIAKKKNDIVHDILVTDLRKLKQERVEIESMFHMSLKKLDHPSFIKTKFKVETIDKFRSVNGKFLELIVNKVNYF